MKFEKNNLYLVQKGEGRECEEGFCLLGGEGVRGLFLVNLHCGIKNFELYSWSDDVWTPLIPSFYIFV